MRFIPYTFIRLVSLSLVALMFMAGIGHAKSQSGTVTFNIDVASPATAKTVKLWFPYPTSDKDQTIRDLKFSGNYTSFSLSHEPVSGALYLYTEWTESAKAKHRTLTVSFHATARERVVKKLEEQRGALPAEVRKYLQAEFWIPSNDRKIIALAKQITAGKKGILQKSRAVYDWVVENTRRDPNAPGCGLGNVEATLAARSGKCADISSVYVALARAAGVPAREVFGLRLGKPGETDITDGHHCWAEFYLPGTGWVPVDPADVRKIMLVKNLTLAQATPYRDYYFGAVDEFRIALQKGGRGLEFAEGNTQKINYFMYPYAEVDGRALDFCQPRKFTFTVSFKEG